MNSLFQKIIGNFFSRHPEKVVLQLPSEHLKRLVRADIYLPPSYFQPEQATHFYPVLFLNDGQDGAALNLSTLLHRLYAERAIPELIVVAFYPGDRMQEYGISHRPDFKGRGSQAKAYADFLIFEFLTFFRSQYRARIGPEHNVFAGFSLGALSAFDLCWHHPEQFGKAGIFSGSLWWRSKKIRPKEPDADRIVHEMVLKDPIRPNLKFWFQTGTEDETSDRNKNGVIDSIDDTLDLIRILKKKGYPASALEYYEVAGGQHHPTTWAKALPVFLTWAFGPATNIQGTR